MMRGRPVLPSLRPLLAAAVLLVLAAGGCASLRQVAALRRVEFDLDRVTDVYVAGVRTDDKRSYSDLSPGDIARLVAAVTAREVPLQLVVHVSGTNPETNNVTARLTRMDWKLFIEDQETVAGRLEREFLFEPGKAVDVPIAAELDLYDFFSGRGEDFFRLALAVAGVGEPTNVALEAQPTIDTPIGPIRYPVPIRIEKTVGSSSP